MSCYQQQSILFDNFSYCAVANSCGNRDMELAYKTKTDLILYSGNNLSCTPITKCDTVTDIIEVFNTEICAENITLKIINEFINNEELANVLCNTIIQKCIDCGALENCITCDVILQCTTTTSTTTVIPPCSCLTFSNSGGSPVLVYLTSCTGGFVVVNVPPGINTATGCGTNPSYDGFPGQITWDVGGQCTNINGYYVCNDNCCNYTVTRVDDPVYIDFLNCFGYWDYLEPDPNTTVSFCAIENEVYVFGATPVKGDCNCVPTCNCYQIDASDSVFTVRWKSCDGEDKAQSLYNESYKICAIPGTVTYSGAGSITVTNLGTSCNLDTDCWEEFVMDATNISGTLTINQVGSTGRYAIEWEPGVFTFYNTPGIFARSYTYTTSYTGPIKIKAPSLSVITRLYMFGPGNFTSPTNDGINITGPEIAKLTSLQVLNIGFQCNARVFCSTTDLSSVLIDLVIYKGNLSGDLDDGFGNPTLSPTITYMGVFGSSTVYGDIQYLPPNMTSCTILGVNNLNGDLANLPPSLASSLTYLQIEGSNDITGDIGSLGAYTSLTYLRILGENTIDGDILGISPLINLTAFMVYGKNGLSGNLSALIPLTVLNTFVVDNDDAVLGPPGIGNTITGDLFNLPSTLVTFVVGKFNTISGDLSSIPSGMVTFVIRQVPVGGGVITGSLGSITSTPMVDFYLVGGSHTFSGTILQLPPTLIRGYLDTSGAISGDLADLPTDVVNFTTISANAGSIFTYTPGRTWAPTMGTMDLVTSGAPGIPTLDDLLIDLSGSGWVVITAPSTYGVRLKGSPSSPAAIAAAASIAATPTNVAFY